MKAFCGSLAYLATPYTRYPKGPDQAFFDASQLAAKLLLSGVKAYSPIAHCFALALCGGIDPLDEDIWLPANEALMERCEVLIVAHMDGWHESKGVTAEIAFFRSAGKPIYDLDPLTMMMVRRGEPERVWS